MPRERERYLPPGSNAGEPSSRRWPSGGPKQMDRRRSAGGTFLLGVGRPSTVSSQVAVDARAAGAASGAARRASVWAIRGWPAGFLAVGTGMLASGTADRSAGAPEPVGALAGPLRFPPAVAIIRSVVILRIGPRIVLDARSS
ncbi:hypothetical protein FRAAL5046 [Frankia alni ACN14a]|uniref:Uncharacterized protein n=1 Tax=Frankia alni (strain DSM 45986 / CECT 9034 / ACN14a) TaxID=326424 RepID=Q0RFQ5_FRAAA|nr:hypothetical protein FRAAL5046 [Frankia alni ACN14a]